VSQVDVAKLPRDPEKTLRDWTITFNDQAITPRHLRMARLVSADSGWIKFRMATAELVMFVSRNVLSAEQVPPP